MTVQTTYSQNISTGYPGMFYGGNPRRVVTALAETAAIGFGLAVTSGTADPQATAGGSGTFLGITARDLANQGNTSNDAEYAVGQAMAVMESGDILVNLTNTGTKGDAIKFIQATGAIAAGAPGAGETAITGGTLEETKAAAGLARIRIKEGS